MTPSVPLRVSVVVPTYKRPDLLERCLAALQRQTLAALEYEIIVCDDGPSDEARRVVEQARAGLPGGAQIHYIEVTATQGPAAARNRGWERARSAVVAFTDDDTVPDAGWLEAGLAAIAQGADAVTGRIEMPLPEEPTDLELDAAGLTRAEFVTANCLVRRDVLEAVGGFDERFSMAWREDSDLHFKLIEGGYTIVRSEEALVVHPLRPMPFGASISMQKKVLYDVLLYRKHPRLYRQRIRPTPPWKYLGISAALLAGVVCAAVGQWVAAGLFLAAWIVASLMFFHARLRPSAKTGRNIIELLVTSFVIPPLSIFWRLVGVRRFGASFP